MAVGSVVLAALELEWWKKEICSNKAHSVKEKIQ